jgi:protein MAK16
MQSDEVVWAVINHQFCAFKATLPGANKKTRKSASARSGNAGPQSKLRTLCRHPDSLTGLCGRAMCPLANSRYATVKEDDQGKIYLRIKEIERSHLPKELWRQILLPRNLKEATAKIDIELAYWPRAMRNRVKQRLVRLRQVQLRSRKLLQKRERQGGQTLVTDPKKIARRERKRESMAERAAEIDVAVKSELLERLRQGTYGSIYNLDAAFDKVVAQAREDQEPVDADEEYDSDDSQFDSQELEYEDEEEDEGDLFVADLSSDEEGDVEDLFEDLGPTSASASAAAGDAKGKRPAGAAASSGSSIRRSAKRRRHVELEVEREDDVDREQELS